MRRRLAAALLLATFLPAACVTSNNDEPVDRAGPAQVPAGRVPGPGRDRLPDVQDADPATVPAPVDATLTGRLVTTDGAAVTDAQADLRFRTGDAINPIGLFFVSALTLGLPLLDCITTPPNICDDSIQTGVSVGPDGTFAAVLPSAHFPGYEGDVDWVLVATRAPPAGQPFGPSSSFEFEVAAAEQDAPPLPMWTPVAGLTTGGTQARIDWERIDTSGFDGEAVGYAVTLLGADGAVILEGGGDPPFAVDTRVLEDTAATVLLTARGNVTSGPTIYHQTMTGPGPTVTGPGPAPSRGAACSLTLDSGEVRPLGPCPATDGDLATAPITVTPPECVPDDPFQFGEPAPFEPFDFPDFTFPTFTTETVPPQEPPPTVPPSPPPPSQPETTTTTTSGFPILPNKEARQPVPTESTCPGRAAALTVDLGSEVSTDLVVVRGCSGCELTSSRDGVTFSPHAAEYDPLATSTAYRSTAPVTVRFVRLNQPPREFGAGPGLSDLREVSIWPAAPSPSPGEAPADPLPGGLEASNDGAPGWLVGLAVVLLAVAAAGLGIWGGRRLARSR